MARDVYRLLHNAGLPTDWAVHVDKPLAKECDPHLNSCGLPLYAEPSANCATDEARQVACADMVVINRTSKVVEHVYEFELDLNDYLREWGWGMTAV